MNVRCCQHRYNSSGTLTKRRFIRPESAIIRREGMRGVDNGEFVFDIQENFVNGDEIYYIQDIVPVENLKGIYNFTASFRDESGYHNDDYVSGTYSLPSCATVERESTGKFRGKQKMRINASSVGVRIPNVNGTAKDESNNALPIFDFSHDFDIYFWIKCDDTRTAVIFDKYNGTTGIKISVNSTNDTVTVLVDDNSTETNITSSSVTGADFTAAPVLVRVGRTGNSIKISLNNTVAGSGTNSGNINTSADLYLFREWDESAGTPAYTGTGFDGSIYQLRIYDDYLTDEDSQKIFAAKMQPTTMKFGGKVWKIDNKTTEKKVIASGFGSLLLNTMITGKNVNGSATMTSNATRDNNVYYRSGNNRVYIDEVIPDIIKEISSSNEYIVHFHSSIRQSMTGDFVAEGLFLDIVKILLQIESTNSIFTISPRKVFIVENESDKNTNVIITKNNFRILESGEDTTKTTNSITGICRAPRQTAQTFIRDSSNSYEIDFTNGSFSDEFMIFGNDYFEAFPISISKVESGSLSGNIETGTFTPAAEFLPAHFTILSGRYSLSNRNNQNCYFFNPNTNRIQISTSGSSGTTTTYIRVTFSYRFEIDSNYSHAGAKIRTSTNATSIANIGEFSRKVNLPQIVSPSDLSTYLNNYITDNKDIKTRVKAETSVLVNSMNEGDRVNVYYPDRNLGSIDSSYNSTTLPLTIKSIEWRYPQAYTKIEMGDFAFTSMDLEQISAESIRQSISAANESTL